MTTVSEQTPTTSLAESVPFAEPQWYRSGFQSPFYNDSHRALAKKVREFVDRELLPNVHEWDEKGDYPADLRERAYRAGVYAMMWPREYGGTPPVEPLDHFHRLVFADEKKFITAGTKADWFTTCVRTNANEAGARGLSVLMIDAHAPGVTVRRLKTQGWWMSGTTYISFDNVRVPAANRIGPEGAGFAIIMENFNDERLMGCVLVNRAARVCIEESIRYARNRKTFGRRLIEHQVIRHKLAEMISRVELHHAQLENICYQLNHDVPFGKLAPLIALLKVSCTKALEFCAREAAQIFGGNSYLRDGVGERVERIYREVRVNAIGGGSEEVMLDLFTRMAKL